jgi:hypothetical protein
MKRIFAAALLLAGASACGGGGNPKEFVLALTNESIVAGPNADCPAVPDPRIFDKPFLSDLRVTVYQGDSTHWYAEVPTENSGTVTLEGTYTNNSYSFTGNIEKDQVDSLSSTHWQQTALTTISIQVKVDGANNVTGTVQTEEKVTCQNKDGNQDTCKNAGLPNYNGAPSTTGNTVDCIDSANLQGVQLADPQFKESASTPGSGGQIGDNF